MDEVAPGVFVATADICTTTTTVIGGDDGGCLLIDPAVTVADLAALAGWLSSRGLRPVAGWSTHPHWDHVLWSRSLGDAARYASPRAATAAARGLARLAGEMRDTAPGHDLSLFARLEPLPANTIPWAGPTSPTWTRSRPAGTRMTRGSRRTGCAGNTTASARSPAG